MFELFYIIGIVISFKATRKKLDKNISSIIFLLSSWIGLITYWDWNRI